MRLSLRDAGRSQALLRILAARRLNGAPHETSTTEVLGPGRGCGRVSFHRDIQPLWLHYGLWGFFHPMHDADVGGGELPRAHVSRLLCDAHAMGPGLLRAVRDQCIGVGRRCGDPILGVQATTGTVRRVRKEL